MSDDRPLVLVADDDPDIVTLVRIRLERAGYRIVAAADGRQALEAAVAEPPVVAVLDVAMPHVDGLEVCRRLKADARTAAVKVLVVTAAVATTRDDQAEAAGADGFLGKPFSPRELVARVQALAGVSG